MTFKTNNRIAFTILEAIFSIILLGFVVALASPSIMGAIHGAKERKQNIVITNIAAAKDLFEATATQTEIDDFNQDRGDPITTNNYRLTMLLDRDLLTSFNQTVSSMVQICEGTGHSRVFINSLDEKPSF